MQNSLDLRNPAQLQFEPPTQNFDIILPRENTFAYPFVNDQRWHQQIPSLLDAIETVDVEAYGPKTVIHIGSVSPILSILPELANKGVSTIWLVDADQLVVELNTLILQQLSGLKELDLLERKQTLTHLIGQLLHKYGAHTEEEKSADELLEFEMESLGNYHYLNRVAEILPTLGAFRFIFTHGFVGISAYNKVLRQLEGEDAQAVLISVTNAMDWIYRTPDVVGRGYVGGLMRTPNSSNALFAFASNTDGEGKYPVMQQPVVGFSKYMKS